MLICRPPTVNTSSQSTERSLRQANKQRPRLTRILTLTSSGSSVPVPLAERPADDDDEDVVVGALVVLINMYVTALS